jgi:crotonobetainyl-CoA:carnitine CoA-transferase CaiB-like acyl-CoA transferase
MSRPLQGCRVLDLGIITAGAATSALLADLGAEVIKVESPGYRDPFRKWVGPRADTGEDSPFFRFTNRGKQGISIDLKRDEGREVFLRLVRCSDIVVENFRRGVMEQLGVDYPVLRGVRPEIILASLSSHGESGPDKDRVSFGTTLEAMAGLAWETGYADDIPVVTGRDLNYPDQVVALFAAGMVLTAWLARQRGHGGAHLDLSQRELTSFLLGERFVEGGTAERRGNADELHALQECFSCRDGRWLALSVLEHQCEQLAVLAGGDVALTLADRVVRWVGAHEADEAVRVLRGAGLACALVLDAGEAMAQRGRLWQDALAPLPDGTLAKGFPFQFEDRPMQLDGEAPTIGRDTAEVLQRVAGYTAAEVEALARTGVIECAGTP